MLRSASFLLRLCALVAAAPPVGASPRLARRIAMPRGPAGLRIDRRAWGAIRAKLGAAFGLVPA